METMHMVSVLLQAQELMMVNGIMLLQGGTMRDKGCCISMGL